MKKKLKAFEKRLGYRFRKTRRLLQACTHRSYRFENADCDMDNQRLEFLGDAVLGCLAADHLYTEHPDFDEGQMTQIRSAVTSTDGLAEIARTLDLGDVLQLGKGEQQSGGDRRQSCLTDALEAVIGAAYIDGGWKAVRKIFSRHFVHLLDIDLSGRHEQNPKGVLQEYCQKKGWDTPAYRIVDTEGPAHDRRYIVEVMAGSHLCATGRGPNKKTAEKDAAFKALNTLRRHR